MGMKAYRIEMEQIKADEELAQKIIRDNEKIALSKRRKNEQAKARRTKLRDAKIKEQEEEYKDFDYAMKMGDVELCLIILENLSQIDHAYRRKNKSIALQGVERGHLTSNQKFCLCMAYNDLDNPIRPISYNKKTNLSFKNKSDIFFAVMISFVLLYYYFFK